MSMFNPPPKTAPSKPARTFKAPTGGQRGDRTLQQRMDAPDAPSSRKDGVRTNAVVERLPRGCLFRVNDHAWFDLDGFFCRQKQDRVVDVTRGAPRQIMAKLTKQQKHELARVRLNARRNGIR